MQKLIRKIAVSPNPQKDVGLRVTRDAVAVMAGCGAIPILAQSM